jgi:hypothetical protein
METENTGSQEFSLSAEADKIIAAGEPSQNSGSENSSNESGNQSNEPQQNSNEEKELSTEDILNQVSKPEENPKANEEILNAINSLGAIHNGLPVKIDSVDQLKEIVQKGFDYTKKTMAHAEAEKAFTDQKAQFESEYKAKEENLVQYEAQLAETINENKTAEAVLRDMQSSDPELFNEFKIRFEAELRRQEQAMPYMKQFENQFQGLQKEINSLKSNKVKEELGSIKNSWESDLTTTQTKYAPMLTKLGVKADWDKVKNIWASDASGKMTVEQALHAAHGADFNKAFTSHKKLLETKQKTSNAMLKKTGVGGSSNPGDFSNKDNMDIGSYLRSVADTL